MLAPGRHCEGFWEGWPTARRVKKLVIRLHPELKRDAIGAPVHVNVSKYCHIEVGPPPT